MDYTELLPRLGSVFALAFFYFSASIPVGVALGIAPVTVGATAWISYMAGVLLVVALGEPLRARVFQRFGGRVATNPDSRLRRIWDRYGLIGLSLLAPVTTGAQIGVIVALALGAPKRRLVIGMAVGAALWAVGITLVVVIGAQAVRPG